MSQHPAPTAPSPRRVRPLGALATLALATAGTLAGPGVASAADAPPKPVKISPTQAPKIVDLPGSENDAVVVTNAVGVTWKVYETGEDAPESPLTFTAKQRTQSVPTGGGESLTVTATAAEGYTLASDVTSWELPYSTGVSNITDITSETVPSVSDYPGVDKDFVTLTAVPGVEWRINGATVPAFKNTKGFPIKKTIEAFAKKNPEATTTPYDPAKDEGVVVTATLLSGYAWGLADDGGEAGTDPISFDNSVLGLTASDVVSIPTTAIDAAIAVNANLPGRTRDTMLIKPVLGVKWSVCGGKTFAITKPTVKSASCDATNGDVPVKAIADKDYKIETGEEDTTSYKTSLSFEDKSAALDVAVDASTDVVKIERNGASQDTLRIKPVQGVTWQYAYAPAAGKTLTWLKVPAPKKNVTESVISIKAAKGATETTVYVRPRPVDFDHAVTGWFADSELPAGVDGAQTYVFASAPTPVDVVAPTIETTTTLAHIPGIASWQVEQTVKVGDKDRVVKSKVVVAPYASVVVQTAGTNVKLTPVPDKDHKIAS